MNQSTLSRELALRIGLAARALDGIDTAAFMNVLTDAVELPVTEEKLAGLKPKQLKQAAGGVLAGQEPAALKAACAILGGASELRPEPPATAAYADGDMPDSLRVACASDNGELLDGHFGSCRQFLIYQVSAHEMRLVDVRTTDAADVADDRNAERAALIADAQVLFVASIGGPAAAKVVRAGVHPIKHAGGGPARDTLKALQATLAAAPPPWLAKAMGHAAEARVRFVLENPEV